MTYDEVFEDLAQLIAHEIHWYQGGAENALRVLLRNRDKFQALANAYVVGVPEDEVVYP